MRMDSDSIIRMELLASEFWPPRNRQTLSNGWILGENGGVTWRANCVLPYGTQENSLDAVKEAERFYEAKNQPPAFKLTDAAPLGLDETLAQRGYKKHMITHMQTRTLNQDSRKDDLLKGKVNELQVGFSSELRDDWLLKQAADERYQGSRLEVLRDILNRIPGKRAFAEVIEERTIVGVGLGVVHKNWLALFSIRTDPDYRRMGIGEAISEALLSWGVENGAKQAFLQVEADNLPAIQLYQKMDFVIPYVYWYRIRNQSRS